MKNIKNIEKYGFLNQHQTGTSSAFLHPRLRLETEKAFLGIQQLNEAKPVPSLLPKYGFLSDVDSKRERSATLKFDSTQHYGEILFVVKPELFDRMSYSIGDSLDGEGGVYQFDSYTNSYTQEVIQAVTTFSEEHTLSENNSDMARAYNHELIRRVFDNYFEVQVWGTLTLADIKEIWILKIDDSELLKTVQRLSEKYQLKVFHIESSPQVRSQTPWKKTLLLSPQRRSASETLASTLEADEVRDKNSLVGARDRDRQEFFRRLVTDEEIHPDVRGTALFCLVTEKDLSIRLTEKEYLQLLEVLKNPTAKGAFLKNFNGLSSAVDLLFRFLKLELAATASRARLLDVLSGEFSVS
jgi:hypothetical protein